MKDEDFTPDEKLSCLVKEKKKKNKKKKKKEISYNVNDFNSRDAI